MTAPFEPFGDGVVRLRPPRAGDAETIVAARDEEFRRWMGPGSEVPAPTACIEVGGRLVGWVDFDRDPAHEWLAAGEVNVGYHIFAPHRGKGYAGRAVELLLAHIARLGCYERATLLIHRRNERSLAVAAKAGFERAGEIGESILFARPLPHRGP